MGRKIDYLPASEVDYILEKSHEILFASEILYSWSIFLSKMAVLTFYRHLFQFTSIRIPIIILMVCSGIWITIRTFMTIFHCMPVQAYWDKSIDGKCLSNIGKYYLGTDLTHCLMDFIILGLPLYEVIRLRLAFGQKIAVIGIFSLGSLYVFPFKHSVSMTDYSHCSGLVSPLSSKSSKHSDIPPTLANSPSNSP